MQRSNVGDPSYYHKVVDCQWGCPAHTNVPEYIRLIAQGRFDDAYMLNRESNVFPGILGRTCDRPCEPACRRTRVDGKPVAICRLKRVAADNKGDSSARLPKAPTTKNGKKVALIGAGPASLTVANDLMPLGYAVTIFEKLDRPGGLMRVNIPSFRLPPEVLDEEIAAIVDMGVEVRYNTPIDSLGSLLDAKQFDAVFVGSGAPKGVSPTPTCSTGSRTCSRGSSAAPAIGRASRRAGGPASTASPSPSAASSAWLPTIATK